MVERLVLLRSIDQLWVDHLTELDDFRRGVGLRGYGGTDPLVEFKREAFKLYDELRGFIRHQVATTIFRVNVQVQQPAPATPPPARSLPMPTPQQMAMLRAAAAARARQAELAAGQTAAGTADGSVQSGDIVTTDDAITETLEGTYGGDDVLADLDLDAEDLAPYDEIEDDAAAPGFVSDEVTAGGGEVTAAAAAAARRGSTAGHPRAHGQGSAPDDPPAWRRAGRGQACLGGRCRRIPARAWAAMTPATAAQASSTRSATASSHGSRLSAAVAGQLQKPEPYPTTMTTRVRMPSSATNRTAMRGSVCSTSGFCSGAAFQRRERS